MTERASRVTEPLSKRPTARGVQAVVCVAGVIMEAYGLYFVLGPGSLLAGLAWIIGGVLLQVTTSLRTTPNERAPRFINPIAALAADIRRLRDRVRRWDDRQ
jgi:hypothetical protein